MSPAAASYITGFDLVADKTNVFSKSTQVTGNVYASDYAIPTKTDLTTAVGDMKTAFTDAAGRAPNYAELYSGDISGRTLTTGVYKWGTGVLINTDVTLSGGASDVFIFQVAKGITQANDTNIILTGGVKPENIFWQASETVSIGADAHFKGVILCQTDITLNTRAAVTGRLLAQTAVTLDHSTVTALSEAIETEAIVNAVYSTVVVPSSPVVSGSSFVVSGAAKDANRTKLSDKAVTVEFDRLTGTTTTDADGAYTVTLNPTKAVTAGYDGNGKGIVEVTVDTVKISDDARDTATVTDSLLNVTMIMKGNGNTPASEIDASLQRETQYVNVTLYGAGSAPNSINNAQLVGTVGAGTPLLSSLTGPYITFAQDSVVKYAAVWVFSGDGAHWVMYNVTGGTTIGSAAVALITGVYTMNPVNATAITGSNVSINF